ncbi:TatD-related deoxyribonuclease [Luteitalea sp. TBR-22]|uniref:TatD family hydrolase n=1 Tax=Luteitalea sp. TBR-22 TaxID=2802971 RepID=UPI001AF092B8|nr:TatD family hydrolase [Luteitalea sp. TBR-22]BCS33301.1 TatD-related deoxyribonuclease [Luteitalea sp. TBR-22]
MLIDTHCHIAGDEFAEDLDLVVDRARAAGVERAICILDATTRVEFDRVPRVREAWPAVRFAAGVHPHHAGKVDAGRVRDVVAAAVDEVGAVAVGEIGLDYHYDFSPRETQRAVFGAQVVLAVERHLPVVIHTREADADTLAVLDESGQGRVRGVFHCFTGDQALAEAAIARGFHLSFSGIVSFPRAGALREVAAWVPADRWLVETDSPYLSPAPHRGGRNEPARVARVLEVLAEVRGLSLAQARAQAQANAEAVFDGVGPTGSAR